MELYLYSLPAFMLCIETLPFLQSSPAALQTSSFLWRHHYYRSLHLSTCKHSSHNRTQPHFCVL